MDIKAETWWDRDEHQEFTGSSVKIFSFIRDPIHSQMHGCFDRDCVGQPTGGHSKE